MKIALLTLLSFSPLMGGAIAAPATSPTAIVQADDHQSDLQAKLESLRQEIESCKVRITRLKIDNDRLQADLKTSQGLTPLKEDRLTSAIFQAKHIEGQELAELASQVFGPFVSFIPSGHPLREDHLNSRNRFTAFSNGKQVIVTEFPEQMEKALELLASLDIGVSKPEPKSSATPAVDVMLYTPKALDPDQVLALLQAEGANDVKVSPVFGTESIRLEGTPSALKATLAHLKVTDHYAPQVRIKGYLVQASTTAPGDDGVALPAPLLSGLKGALPNQHFTGIASMFLQSSAGQGQKIRTTTSPRTKVGETEVMEWGLDASMRSYDSEAGLLSLNGCHFNVTIPNSHGTGLSVEQLSVDLMLRKNEYTVVGSILGGSMYLVLSFEEI